MTVRITNSAQSAEFTVEGSTVEQVRAKAVERADEIFDSERWNTVQIKVGTVHVNLNESTSFEAVVQATADPVVEEVV